MLRTFPNSVWQFVLDLRREWAKDRVGGLAAEIAFYAVLGLFPAVLALAAALGSLDLILGEGSATDAEEFLLERLQDVFGADNSLEGTIGDLFDSGNTSALTVGALLSVYASSRGFVAVVRALDIAYDHEHRRGWLATRLVGLGLALLTIVVAAVVLTMVVVGPLFGEGQELADDLGLGSAFGTAWDWFRWPLVLVMVMAWAATVYHVGPAHQSPWRWELPGALLATLWWLTVSMGFRAYLDLASSGANAIYGLLGGALSVLFWFYLLAMGLLVGAEVNGLLATRFGVSVVPPETRPWRDRLDDARSRLPGNDEASDLTDE